MLNQTNQKIKLFEHQFNHQTTLSNEKSPYPQEDESSYLAPLNQQNTLKSQLASMTDIRDIGDLEGQIDSLIYEMDGIERHRSMFTEMLSSSDPEISAYNACKTRRYHRYRGR